MTFRDAYALLTEAAGAGLDVDFRCYLSSFDDRSVRVLVTFPDGRVALDHLVPYDELLPVARRLADCMVQGCDPVSWSVIIAA